jgi:NTP pyrophosphatase (non-canonical NTP hydrolase)|tara:strand:- start:151 stop:981 length:831 start_codon:yes stop_codon:yes gene_type:complete
MAITLEKGKYKIYHIPGKKIGCTTNLKKRVEMEQGYKSGEYEILFETDDILEASKAEETLQNDLGYKVDLKPYNELFKSKYMRTHSSSEATTTFRISLNDINNSFLADLVIETSRGKFILDSVDKIEWVLSNVHSSQFGPSTCYIYNKAMAEAGAFAIFRGPPDDTYIDYNKTISIAKNIDRFENIRQWSNKRNILQKGDIKTQLIKLYEETGELAKAVLEKDEKEIIDAIGDSIIVLTNLAYFAGTTIEDCIDSAYKEISNRTGKMINGTFIKDE